MEVIFKDMESRCNEMLRIRMAEVFKVWQRVGFEGGSRLSIWQRMQQLHSTLDANLMEIVRKEFDFELTVIDECNELQARIRQMHEQLIAQKIKCQLPSMHQLNNTATLCDRRRQLQRMMNELEFAKLRNELQNIFQQIRTISFRLQLPEEQLEQWQQMLQLQRPSESDKKLILNELLRLKQLVLPQMPQYISSCRQEIQQLRDQTFASLEEIQDFAAIWNSEDYCEQLLQLHEQEVSRLRCKLQKNSALYTAVTEWQINWEKQHQLQMRMKDPTVLNNRGGILLKIEKQMKLAATAAAASEKQLMQLHADAPHVLISGQLPADFIASAKLLAEAEKENEAKERQVKHETTLMREMRYGSKPVSPVQRKIIFNSTRPHANHNNNNNNDSRNMHKSTLGCSGRISKAHQNKPNPMRAVRQLSKQDLKQLCNDSTITDLPNNSRLDIHGAGICDVSVSSNYSNFRLGIAFRSSSVMPATCASSVHDSGLSSLDHKADAHQHHHRHQ